MEVTTMVPAHLTNSTLDSSMTTFSTIPPPTTTLQTTTSLVDETTIYYDTTTSTTNNEIKNESDRSILSTNEPDMADVTTVSTTGEEIVETTIISATSTTTRNARSFNTETTTLVAIPLLSLQLPDRNLLNDGDIDIDMRNYTTNKNDTEDKLPSSSTPINQHSSEASRTVKTILYAFVIFVCIIAAGMLMHLLVFHMYICTKGLTTYEYLKPPVPAARLTSPTSPRESRKGYDPTVGISSAGKNGKRMITSSSRGSANMSTKLGKEGANNVQYDDGSEGDQTNVSIEEESEAIWTTMTEIDLNAPSDFIGGTLPRNMNSAGLGAGGGIVYQPSEFPTEENDLERINNEKNKTLNAMSLAGGNYLLKSSDVQKGKKKKSKSNSAGKSKDKETESSSGEKKTKSSFSKKWNDLFGSGGSSNKVNPTAADNNEDNNLDT